MSKKEITLSDGRKAVRLFKPKGYTIIKAIEIAGEGKPQMVMMAAVASLVVQIEGASLVMEDVLELEAMDFFAVITLGMEGNDPSVLSK